MLLNVHMGVYGIYVYACIYPHNLRHFSDVHPSFPPVRSFRDGNNEPPPLLIFLVTFLGAASVASAVAWETR